ncbi:unnamed protein product [Didymodactylos carnosus]|uniref:Reverse transcriptase domain-containing protein n=1 Tax=Didymodactylos carnosus TaxID=1234261 RepID=A0A814QEI5_9BILA|nr:unnamed protein product [Didymodactylos carnosus]CAF3882569.1 unnamed protein product [Didymodactylos carnosus]
MFGYEYGNPALTILSAYAPTYMANGDEKSAFYDALSDCIKSIPKHNVKLVLADMNARIGRDMSSRTIGSSLYHDKTNDNGERLIELCETCDMREIQSKFRHRQGRLWTWRHTSGQTAQLDHILVNSKWRNSIRNCRAYNTMNVDSDHRVVCYKFKLRLRATKKCSVTQSLQLCNYTTFALKFMSRVHILRRILEGCHKKNPPFVATFVDFKKAFDSIHRVMIFNILRNYGIPQKIVDAIRLLHDTSIGSVLVDGRLTKEFRISLGVLQGDVLAPFLFIIVIDYIMRRCEMDNYGFICEKRTFARHLEKRLSDLDYADDICLLENSIQEAQQQLDVLNSNAIRIGLEINITKTEYITNVNAADTLKGIGSATDMAIREKIPVLKVKAGNNDVTVTFLLQTVGIVATCNI